MRARIRRRDPEFPRLVRDTQPTTEVQPAMLAHLGMKFEPDTAVTVSLIEDGQIRLPSTSHQCLKR